MIDLYKLSLTTIIKYLIPVNILITGKNMNLSIKLNMKYLLGTLRITIKLTLDLHLKWLQKII